VWLSHLSHKHFNFIDQNPPLAGLGHYKDVFKEYFVLGEAFLMVVAATVASVVTGFVLITV
jgi:hypothetical protein